MASRRPDYTEAELAAITGALERAAPGAVVDGAALRDQLWDLLAAVGLAAESAFDEAFNTFADKPVPHAELAGRYRTLAAAENPFAPGLITGYMRSELNAHARGRWPERRPRAERPHIMLQPFLTQLDGGPARLRALAGWLADRHQRAVRRGHPRKTVLDTLLIRLAEIYMDVTGFDGHLDQLPHAPSSFFIRFAHAALRPFFGPTEATPKALSNRWARLKAAERAARDEAMGDDDHSPDLAGPTNPSA